MSRLTPSQGLLKNLAGEIPEGRREYLPPEKALELLKSFTGQDFGYDLDAWKQWIRKNPQKTWPSRIVKPAQDTD